MLAALLLAAQSIAMPSKPVAIKVLLPHLHDWNGRPVVVRGWTAGCYANSPNLQGRCYLTPSRKWNGGRDRMRLVDFSHAASSKGADRLQVVVHGTVEDDKCPTGSICLDGESYVRVDAIETDAKRHS